jgi:glutaredoxin
MQKNMDIVMYSIPGCAYCSHAKELFRRAEVDYEHYIVGKDLTRTELLEKYPLAYGYPYIIIDGEPIAGGLVETVKLFVQKGLVSSKS